MIESHFDADLLLNARFAANFRCVVEAESFSRVVRSVSSSHQQLDHLTRQDVIQQGRTQAMSWSKGRLAIEKQLVRFVATSNDEKQRLDAETETGKRL